MRIVGKGKKDYFDGALPGGVYDGSVVWVRTQKKIHVDEIPGLGKAVAGLRLQHMPDTIHGIPYPVKAEPVVHVVCGVARRSWRISVVTQHPALDPRPWRSTPDRLVKQIVAFVAKARLPNSIAKAALDPETQKKWAEAGMFSETRIPDDAHRLVGAPAFIVSPGSWECRNGMWGWRAVVVTNPNLADLDLPAIVPAGEMHRAIDEFLSSAMAPLPPPPPVAVSDEIKAEKRGFDQWSFRRHPADSKKPRRRGKGTTT